MIKAIIIDDEKSCCDTLRWQLEKYCPGVTLAGTASDAETGKKLLQKERPGLVFLDVEMPGKTGFELLEDLSSIDFSVIFTTAFEQYAIRAIKFGALDYLVKPIDKDELIAAIARLPDRAGNTSLDQVQALLDQLKRHRDFSSQKIALPTLHGFELLLISSIVTCESRSNYTNIRSANGKELLISRTLKEIEELLNAYPFFRVHNSFLVNLTYATSYIKGDGGSLILSENLTVPVARSKKDELLKLISPISQ